MFQCAIKKSVNVWWLSKLIVVLGHWSWHVWKIPHPESLVHLYCRKHKTEQFNHLNIHVNVVFENFSVLWVHCFLSLLWQFFFILLSLTSALLIVSNEFLW